MSGGRYIYRSLHGDDYQLKLGPVLFHIGLDRVWLYLVIPMHYPDMTVALLQENCVVQSSGLARVMIDCALAERLL